MRQVLDILNDETARAFSDCGYDVSLGRVTVSDRPDLCEYQCNGAMAGAKIYRKSPAVIAGEVASALKKSDLFESVEAVKPGFINMTLRPSFIAGRIELMDKDGRLGVSEAKNRETVVIDYGGANVAKPLHVGHLRSAVIGESIKRMLKFSGHNVIGDVHLGDWGLQMGLIITELKSRQPDLPYFDPDFSGEYPEEAPFDITQLEEIYPCANEKAKHNEEFKEAARRATAKLQEKDPGYYALWKHILNVSVRDLKKNYDRLNVHFDLWGKESDAQEYIPGMIKRMKDEGYATLSQGALVVDVREETDTKEIPPCMILKSDGATLYNTTDLATLTERMEKFHPDRVIYVVDKRQELYFEQIFRCARKTRIVDEDTDLVFVGFGTMNGRDGKPFKTRDGGVMRLETLLGEVDEAVTDKMLKNRPEAEEESAETLKRAKTVGLAAVKYGDLSNQASKDYIFDIDRFTSFEGNTGPYILYTIVRIKSILEKYKSAGGDPGEYAEVLPPDSALERALMLALIQFPDRISEACREIAPHKVCAAAYDLSNAFNRFYHETRILGAEDKTTEKSLIRLLVTVKRALELCIDLLGFSAPDRM